MARGEVPETIENQWDILFRDYPEMYDRFGRIPKQPTCVEVINQHFPLRNKTVIDVGSGSGISSFELAEHADHVIGIEPVASMINPAVQVAQDRHISNVEFLLGRAENLPLGSGSVDVVVAAFLQSLYSEENVLRFAQESERVVRKGGAILAANNASRWYGGELAPIIWGKSRREMKINLRDRVFRKLGYGHIDFFSIQDYGTVENTVKTYGFIFGKNAIDYIRKHKKTAIKWKTRIDFKIVV
jgi:ubiquinone/menaquinone biosynthesis C-methylase UbiE